MSHWVDTHRNRRIRASIRGVSTLVDSRGGQRLLARLVSPNNRRIRARRCTPDDATCRTATPLPSTVASACADSGHAGEVPLSCPASPSMPMVASATQQRANRTSNDGTPVTVERSRQRPAPARNAAAQMHSDRRAQLPTLVSGIRRSSAKATLNPPSRSTARALRSTFEPSLRCTVTTVRHEPRFPVQANGYSPPTGRSREI